MDWSRSPTMASVVVKRSFQLGLVAMVCMSIFILRDHLFDKSTVNGNTLVLTDTGDNTKMGTHTEDIKSEQKTSLNERSLGGFHPLEGRDIYIYSAIWDHRFDSRVRLFGMQTNLTTDRQFFCNFHFSRDVKAQVPLYRGEAIYPHWPSTKLKYLAHFYECKVPLPIYNYKDVQRFSVVADGLSRETFIPLTHVGLKQDRQDLAVCVKGIWGSVDAIRLVEWIEFNVLLGVQKIVLYDTTTVGAASRVLEHYMSTGIVDVVPFDYALHMSSLMHDDPMRRHLANDGMMLEQTYLVSTNDCLYRYRDDFKYVAVIDLDEIIVPSSPETLPSVIQRALVQHPKAASFAFSTAWHFESYGTIATNGSVPSFLHMQNYLKRTPVTQSQPKNIVITDQFYTVNWHSVIIIPVGVQGNVFLPWETYGYVHHFRQKCKYRPNKCQELEEKSQVDDIIPRYKHLMKERAGLVLSFLNLVSS